MVSGGVGGQGSKSKNKSQTNQQSTNESGTKFNDEFLTKALAYFGNPKEAIRRQQAELPGMEAEYADISSRGKNAYLDQPYAQDLAARIKAAKELQNYPTEDITIPDYNPQYVRSGYNPGAFTGGAYTGANFTPVEGGDFAKIGKNLYEGQQAKIRQAYEQGIARQREELAQSGALNSPSQYLEGSARSSMDRSYLENLQQAARDAENTTLGLKASEAARQTNFDVGQGAARTAYDVGQGAARTAYDVGEGAARTAYDVGEAGRETQFNEQTAARLLELWLKKLALAIDSGRFSFGQSTGQSQSEGSSIAGGGNAEVKFMK